MDCTTTSHDSEASITDKQAIPNNLFGNVIVIMKSSLETVREYRVWITLWKLIP